MYELLSPALTVSVYKTPWRRTTRLQRVVTFSWHGNVMHPEWSTSSHLVRTAGWLVKRLPLPSPPRSVILCTRSWWMAPSTSTATKLSSQQRLCRIGLQWLPTHLRRLRRRQSHHPVATASHPPQPCCCEVSKYAPNRAGFGSFVITSLERMRKQLKFLIRASHDLTVSLAVWNVKFATVCKILLGVESLQSHCIHTQFHWSSGSPVCFPSWGTQFRSPDEYLCETGILLLTMSRYMGVNQRRRRRCLMIKSEFEILRVCPFQASVSEDHKDLHRSGMLEQTLIRASGAVLLSYF